MRAATERNTPAPVLVASDEAARSCLDAEASALAARWAPAFLQHTSSSYPERDRPLPVDFDGDWDATNNWSHLTPSVLAHRPAVYYSAVLTRTHAYLTYTLFYPRDWVPVMCVPYACHDNDLEVVMVVAERGAEADDPRALVFVESKFHTKFVAERGAEIARARDGRPVLEVETEGHGITPALASDRLDVEDAVLLRHDSSQGTVQNARSETYALLPLYSTLWQRRAATSAGGRLWTNGDGGFLAYQGARFGTVGRHFGATMANKEYRGGVRPPWGIDPDHNRGDWFFDPAFGALARHGGFFRGAPASLDYELNPYVADLIQECTGERCARALGEAAPASLPATFPLATVGFLLLRGRRRLRAKSARAAQLPPRP